MKKYLPILGLMACTRVTDQTDDRCLAEKEVVVQACTMANVIGTNDNIELYSAVDDLKACYGDDIKTVCSDTGSFKIITFNQKL